MVEHTLIRSLRQQDALCLSQCLVVAQPYLHHASLVVVGRYDVLLHQLLYLRAVAIQVALYVVVVQLGLQRFELSLRIVVVALELCHFFQFVELLLADLVVGESRLDDALLEVCIVGIRQVEVRCRGYGGMTVDVVNHVVEHYFRRVQSV